MASHYTKEQWTTNLYKIFRIWVCLNRGYTQKKMVYRHLFSLLNWLCGGKSAPIIFLVILYVLWFPFYFPLNHIKSQLYSEHPGCSCLFCSTFQMHGPKPCSGSAEASSMSPPPETKRVETGRTMSKFLRLGYLVVQGLTFFWLPSGYLTVWAVC